MTRYFYDLMLLSAAVIWGSGFIAADIAVEYWPPTIITALRFTIAALLFFIIISKNIKNMVTYWRSGLVVGFFLALGFILQTEALNYTTPAKNAFLTATSVILTPFLYVLFSHKKIAVKNLLGALLALLGIGILNFDGQSLALNNTGDILTLICAIFFALHIYFIGYFLVEKKCDLQALIFWQFFFAALFSWLASLFTESKEPLLFFSRPGFAVIYLGLFSTLLCFFLQNLAQRKVNPNKTAIILSTEALFGTIFSLIFRGEVLSINMVIGFVVLFSAIFIVEIKFSSKNNC